MTFSVRRMGRLHTTPISLLTALVLSRIGSTPMTTTLTQEQAFRAMFLFLQGYWSEFKTATLADVLSDLQPAEQGQSSDPAAWHDFARAVEAATR